MSDPNAPISPDELAHAEGLEGWRQVGDSLMTVLETSGFSRGAALLPEIAQVADELNHHPDVDVRYGEVVIRTTSHDVGHLTSRDVELARRISTIANRTGTPMQAPNVDPERGPDLPNG
ncbi:pterin-4-alpha-carbinolamine dehydratase [Intrasporangium chromatireducens Q5-1]|uniref:Putative pterin-4-alpha-carbinolamine dehydratase n=1 Tax=Intrasporangium chromatireducens Q5-1 TaxID=584657 RepID=W9GML8_9MICO|nr:4a-hydroxytetrahydrobiopterin dehydratase [Intrasporangium chromatireducens]EWT07360.1 pterin-4-alpha-carbinolamine dehydratase [Intrasporangium chromatireducens Q5-1]